MKVTHIDDKWLIPFDNVSHLQAKLRKWRTPTTTKTLRLPVQRGLSLTADAFAIANTNR